mmetsp:Transcript_1269/g.1998  ORF Transcript_1269/g.1998 Transcript_1269/m.1998 type:complete len:211 (-) Transcript_1269:732-1364(-)
MIRIFLIVGCQIFGIHMFQQGLLVGFGTFLGNLDLLLDFLTNFLFHGFQFFGFGKSRIDHGIFNKFQWITCGPGKGNFFSCTVGRSGVTHGMTVITVGHHFDIHGTIARSTIVLDKSHTLLDGQHIHTINTNSRNMISHFVIIIVRGMTINTGTHTIMIVFNAKNHGQFPQRGHIGRFPNLSLIGGTISITGNGDIHGFTGFGIVFIGKG